MWRVVSWPLRKSDYPFLYSNTGRLRLIWKAVLAAIIFCFMRMRSLTLQNAAFVGTVCTSRTSATYYERSAETGITSWSALHKLVLSYGVFALKMHSTEVSSASLEDAIEIILWGFLTFLQWGQDFVMLSLNKNLIFSPALKLLRTTFYLRNAGVGENEARIWEHYAFIFWHSVRAACSQHRFSNWFHAFGSRSARICAKQTQTGVVWWPNDPWKFRQQSGSSARTLACKVCAPSVELLWTFSLVTTVLISPPES